LKKLTVSLDWICSVPAVIASEDAYERRNCQWTSIQTFECVALARADEQVSIKKWMMLSLHCSTQTGSTGLRLQKWYLCTNADLVPVVPTFEAWQ
jgi:hypothetical protein